MFGSTWEGSHKHLQLSNRKYWWTPTQQGYTFTCQRLSDYLLIASCLLPVFGIAMSGHPAPAFQLCGTPGPTLLKNFPLETGIEASIRSSPFAREWLRTHWSHWVLSVLRSLPGLCVSQQDLVRAIAIGLTLVLLNPCRNFNYKQPWLESTILWF